MGERFWIGGLYVMPEISRFYGVVIKMFFRGEHNPPHIHAIYGEYNGLIDIQTGELIEGDLPDKQYLKVKEWTIVNKDKLLFIWESKQLMKIPPLK